MQKTQWFTIKTSNKSPNYSKPISILKLYCTFSKYLQASKTKTQKIYHLASSHKHFNKHQNPIPSFISHTCTNNKMQAGLKERKASTNPPVIREICDEKYRLCVWWNDMMLGFEREGFRFGSSSSTSKQ